MILSGQLTYPTSTQNCKMNPYYCRARKLLSKSALINLYYAFIFPYLINCVEVWGNALSTHTQPLIKLQNKIMRIITNSNFLALF